MLSTNVSATWKKVKNAFVKVSGNWKTVGQIYVNVSGKWKQIWNYSWKTGSWSKCSVSCGTGTQTRTVTCVRKENNSSTTNVDDKFCTKFVGTKPATSQSCKATTNCETCGYKVNKKGSNYAWVNENNCSALGVLPLLGDMDNITETMYWLISGTQKEDEHRLQVSFNGKLTSYDSNTGNLTYSGVVFSPGEGFGDSYLNMTTSTYKGYVYTRKDLVYKGNDGSVGFSVACYKVCRKPV